MLAKEESEHLPDKAFDAAVEFLKENLGKWQSPYGYAALVLFVLLSLYLALWLLSKYSEFIDKIWSFLRTFPAFEGFTAEQRAQRRRKAQFCKIMRSDIEALNKHENWNDQHFAELEAEVEAEGYYYPSRLHQLFRIPSSGIRRVRSLTRAIESSAEPALLVVGEPGSGKSVAMRHLAIQLAEQGIQSQSRHSLVPLYINLKELPHAAPNTLNADFIRQFIVDHVRRGDADTAAFLQENWETYRSGGVWYFVFDSFDEIPAVLHAPAGSSVISDHAEAIRQFLTGMPDCRGCVASREYKGPDALPWQKRRIMPLSQRIQDNLIDNTYLTTQQKTVVHSHLAAR